MPYKLVFLFLLVSCTNYSSNFEKKSGYSASGFAYIEKNIPSQLENEKFFISQNKLRTGTKINIINPLNKKSLELQIKKKIEYDNFYKVLISKSIVKELELSSEFPFVEITEIIPMKSFIAKKAITQDEEKKIANRAPIDLININNISKKKKTRNKKRKKLLNPSY
tara:strand:- start:153 stop:650 length:498 start_codon:yes stop_codon:yes gene_type:complete